MFWLLCLAEVVLFLESGHTERERERERERGGGGGGVRDWTELTAAVNFALSSMPNDMHVEERQARLERELKWWKSEESDKTHRSVPASCLDPLQSKLGFSHISIFNQSAERAAWAAPNEGDKKGAIFLLVFRCLNHTASPWKAFCGVQKGQVHSKKHKPSKKYFCWRSTPGSPPAGLNRTKHNSAGEWMCCACRCAHSLGTSSNAQLRRYSLVQ